MQSEISQAFICYNFDDYSFQCCHFNLALAAQQNRLARPHPRAV